MAVAAPTGPKPSDAFVLKFDEREKTWQDDTLDLLPATGSASLPDVCYIFLESGDYYKGEDKQNPCSESDRRKILAPFGAPDFLSSQLCTDLNGYFGCQSSLIPGTPAVTGQIPEKLNHIKTWFRCITKKVLRLNEGKTQDGKDYLWYEMGFFTEWSGDEKRCKVLCIGTPPELRQQLHGVLNASPELRLKDPFALLRILLDEVVKLYDDHTWRVTKMVREVEKNRDERPDFEKLNNLLRHAGHIVEIEAVALETLEHIVSRQKSVFTMLPDGHLDLEYTTQAEEYLAFQQQMIKSIRWRAQATQQRLEGEITLAYNMLASSDNAVMKSITLLTMVFLPATFISALFSTTFFSFSENSWQMSARFWMYWAVVVPLTLVLLAVWWFWLGGSYKKIRSKYLREEV